MQKTLSILIPTISDRKYIFEELVKKLNKQINDNRLGDKIEIISKCDNRIMTIGEKRNLLLHKAKGKYTMFIDDDDDVSDDFIQLIYKGCLFDADCLSLTGIITTDGINPRLFIHSIQHQKYLEKNNVYYRPPNHLNPIKSTISKKFVFPSKNHSEDSDYAEAILKSGLLQTEIQINKPYYFYQYTTLKP
jgi:hypothetical protein